VIGAKLIGDGISGLHDTDAPVRCACVMTPRRSYEVVVRSAVQRDADTSRVNDDG
jgi:hypothetical protein